MPLPLFTRQVDDPAAHTPTIYDAHAETVNEMMDELEPIASATLHARYSGPQTLSATLQLADSDYPIQRIDCNGANRIVKMPAFAAANHAFFIINTTPATYTLDVQSSAGVSLIAVPLEADGGYVLVLPNGADGYIAYASGGASFNDGEGDPSNTGVKADGTSDFAARRNHDHGEREKLTAARTYYVRVDLGEVTWVVVSDQVQLVAHGLQLDDPIVFRTTGALPPELTPGTVYYARDIAADTFKVAATPGGAALLLSAGYSGSSYVATGNDANNGLAQTRAGAFLTIDKAIDTAVDLDASIYDVTIDLGNSTYAEDPVLKPLLGSGRLIISGDTGTPANVTIDGGFTCNGLPGNYTLEGATLLKNTTSLTTAINLKGQVSLRINALNFSTGWTIHMISQLLAIIELYGSYTISGAATRHIYILLSGVVVGPSSGTVTITITGTPAFSTGFIINSLLGLFHKYSSGTITFSGGATGKRYDATSNSVINTNGGGANYFPGDVAGTTATGGLYQ